MLFLIPLLILPRICAFRRVLRDLSLSGGSWRKKSRSKRPSNFDWLSACFFSQFLIRFGCQDGAKIDEKCTKNHSKNKITFWIHHGTDLSSSFQLSSTFLDKKNLPKPSQGLHFLHFLHFWCPITSNMSFHHFSEKSWHHFGSQILSKSVSKPTK